MNIIQEFMVYDGGRAFEWLKLKGCPIMSRGRARNCEAELGDGIWKPVMKDGIPVVLLPVISANEEVVEIIAFEPSAPEKVYFRHGYFGSVLGEEYLHHQLAFLQPVRIHDTPLDWLMADMDGCCLLSERAYELVSDAREIVASERLFNKIIASLMPRLPVRGAG